MRRRYVTVALIAVMLWALAQGVGYCQQAPPTTEQQPAPTGQAGEATPPTTGQQPEAPAPAPVEEATPPAPAPPLAVEHPVAVAPPSMAGPFQGPSPVPHELTIPDAIAIALRNNPTVAIAEEDVRAAAGGVQQAASALMPHAQANVQRTTPVDLPPFTFQARGSTWQTTFTINWLLYNWGAARNSYQAARNLTAAAADSYVRTDEQIAYNVRQNYYAVLTARTGVDVQQEVLNSAQENLRVARLRYEAGVAPQYDVLAAEARVASVQQELVAAQGRLDVAWAALAQVLGVPIPPGTVVATPPLATPAGTDLPILLETAFAQRADLRAAECQMYAAERQLAATRVGARPSVSAVASYTFLPSTSVNLGLPGEQPVVVSQNSGFIALAISWPMFTAGLVEGETQTAQARYEQTRENVQSVRNQIDFGVRSAYFLVQSAQAQIVAGEKEVTQATEALRIANLRYREGVGTSVEVLQAEVSLQDARTRLNEATFTLNLAVAGLDLAVGRPVPPELLPPGRAAS
jgi:outer membrane protein